MGEKRTPRLRERLKISDVLQLMKEIQSIDSNYIDKYIARGV